MKIFCDLKVVGIDTIDKYTELVKSVELDELQFFIPKNNEDDYYYIHLDFEKTIWNFDENKKEIVVSFSDLAETFEEINAEEGFENSDINIELLNKGFLSMYIIFLMDKNDEFITDVSISKIYYINEDKKRVLFKIDEEYCANHAGAYYV